MNVAAGPAPLAASGTRRRPRRSASAFEALRGVQWSLGYAALLAWTFLITTYAIIIPNLGDVVMGAALVGLLLEGKFRCPRFMLWFGALCLWAAIGLVGTPYPEMVTEQLIALFKVWLIALVAVNVLSTPQRIRLFLLAFVLFYAAYPARGAIFNYFGGYRWFGRAIWNHIYENPNDLAALTLLPLSVAVGLFMTERNRIYRLGALAAMIVLPVVILLTQSRGVFLALAGFALLALVGHRRKGQAVVLVSVVALVATMFVPSSAWQRFGRLRFMTDVETIDMMDKEGSAEQRWEIWKVAGEIILDNPVTGVGWGAYPAANANYAPIGAATGVELGARDTHSTYLNVLAETGVPGFLFFLATITASVLHAEPIRRRIRLVAPRWADQIYYLELGLFGFLMAGIFASYSRLTFLYVHLALLFVLPEAYRRMAAPARAARRRSRITGAASRPAGVGA